MNFLEEIRVIEECKIMQSIIAKHCTSHYVTARKRYRNRRIDVWSRVNTWNIHNNSQHPPINLYLPYHQQGIDIVLVTRNPYGYYI